MPSLEQKVSYSALGALQQCSYKFYLDKIEGLPSNTHPKTIIGSMIHSILECLARPRHKKHYDLILNNGSVDYKKSKVIIRQIRFWRWKHKIADFLLEDINEMLKVALVDNDFFFKDAKKVFEPEHEFLLEVEGAKLKGIIDRMAEYEDYFLIRDYKTSAAKFDKNELLNSFQAHMYQWYIKKKFNKPAIVEFVFLRHAPTKRTPEKHIQRVLPIDEDQDAGFEYYAKHMYHIFNSFTLKDAYDNFCSDYGFCKNVCPYFKSYKYAIVKEKETNKVIKKYLVDASYQIKDNQYVEIKEFPGCPKYYKLSN